MKKSKFMLGFLGLILLVACGKSVNIEYTVDKVIPTFNVSLEQLDLKEYTFSEKEVKINKTSTLVVAENNHIRLRLKVNKEKKVEEFELFARGDLKTEDYSKIIKLIKDTLKDQNLYKIEEGVLFGAKGITFILKK